MAHVFKDIFKYVFQTKSQQGFSQAFYVNKFMYSPEQDQTNLRVPVFVFKKNQIDV